MMLLIMAITSAYAANSTDRAFQTLRNLVGDWQGSDQQGNPVASTFKLAASGTALLETLTMSGMHEMLTVYSVDKNAIALLHYCPTNNQPVMRAIPPESEIKELVFQFQSAGNLPSIDIGHEHKLVIRFEDQNHLTERWTWRQNGQDSEMIYRLVRKP
jgi:hypothetical protein